MADLINPRVLKGFRDFMPEDEAFRLHIEKILEASFRSFGFVPIDTPVLEYSEILLGKGGGETDKQVYRFDDHGGRDVSLRFDLTVPFARFMAAHGRELPMPFKRYHIAKVWRGENTQRGRYREFKQCDFDIVGVDSVAADLEIILLIEGCFSALGISEISIELSQRQIFNRFMGHIGCDEQAMAILRLVDKLPKIGTDKVLEGLSELVSTTKAEGILEYIKMEDSFAETLAKVEEAAGGPGDDTRRLSEILSQLSDLGVTCVKFNPSITRGLDYYTGVVYETFLNDLPGIGSVCSGGRYNNLASLYTKQELPGVGASIGLDRLIAALDELGKQESSGSGAQVFILMLDESLGSHYQHIAKTCRDAGIRTEVSLSKRKLGQQFQIAEKKGIPFAIICGEDEHSAGTVNVKNIDTRESLDSVSIEDAIGHVLSAIESGS